VARNIAREHRNIAKTQYVNAIVIPRGKHAAAVAVAEKEYQRDYYPVLARRNLRRAGAVYNFLQMAACIEQQHRSEITDWRAWAKAVSEIQSCVRDGRQTSTVAQRDPELAKLELLLRPAAEVAQAEIAEANDAFTLSVKAAADSHRAKVAQADREYLVGKRKVRANRRAAKNARNRVFKRFLETGNEQHAVEELKSLVGILGFENVS